MLDGIYNFLNELGYHHPIHITEVHMPIGLVVAALAFSLFGLFFRRPYLATVSRYCFILAFIFLFPTIIFGIMDWQHYYDGSWLYDIKMKLILAGILLLLLGIGVFLNRGGQAPPVRIVPIYFLSFLTVVALGYYGGEIVLGGRSPNIPPEFRQAAKIFNAQCSMCHPAGGNIANPKVPLRNAPQLASFQAFVRQIRNPKLPSGQPGAMPPISKGKLSDEEAWELYQYILHVLGCPPEK
jgi:uncharacterized membrane protein